MVEAAIRVGSFDLGEQIGRGGMGVVLAGTHRATGVPVAVKLLTRAHAESARRREALLDEVRAMARLDHPGIVTVFDAGTVSDDEARVGGDLLTTGSAWLAMERIGGTSLAHERGKLDWKRLEETLRGLLGALAHAHARGVIHRDLKPSNVLRDRESGRALLMDFGLAHALGEADRRDIATTIEGTPHYMAPEQVEGRWRDFGPWTDLYALGCLTWSLVTGGPPFAEAKDLKAVMRCHRFEKPSRLLLRPGLPDGLADWVDILLRKAPRERFGRAAEALGALVEIVDDPRKSDAWMPVRITKAAETMIRGLEDSQSTAGSTELFDEGATLSAGWVSGDLEATRTTAPTVPVRVPLDWRRRRPVLSGRQLLGAGVGLFGLRTIPMVGREAERDELWRELRDVAVGRGPRVVLLRGAPGIGKSRLAAWLCERAHETGVATVLRAVHSPDGGGAGAGIAAMIGRHLGVEHLPVAAALDRIEAGLGPSGGGQAEARALMGLCAPMLRGGGDVQTGFTSPSQRHEALRQLLLRESERRVVVLWLDDVQWGREAQALALHLLERPAPGVLIVATERVTSGPPEGALAELAAHDRVLTRELAALADREVAELSGRLLGLQPTLAAELASRSGGSPLFAMQIVGAWLEAGALESREGGFDLREEALTVGLDAGETGLVDAFLSPRDDDDAVALEIASLLGVEVEEGLWRRACGLAGARGSGRLVDAMLRAGLAVRTPDAQRRCWRFAHGMVAEALRARAEAAGRSASLHAACADALTADEQAAGHRVALHLLRAGRHDDALAPLLDSALRAYHDGDFDSMARSLALAEETMDELGLPPDDVRRVEAAIHRSVRLRRTGHVSEAVELATELVGRARAIGAAGLLVRSLRALGVAHHQRGETVEAVELLREAEATAAAAGEVGELLRVRNKLADALLKAGRRGEAEAVVRAGLAVEPPADPRLFLTVAGLHRAVHRAQDAATDEGRQHLQLAASMYEQAGALWGLAATHNDLGELARQSGALEEARGWYVRSIEEFNRAGLPGLIPVVNLGLVLLEQGRFADVREVAVDCLRVAERRERHDVVLFARLLLLVALAETEAWGELLEQLWCVQDELRRTPVWTSDSEALCRRAAEAARARDVGLAYQLDELADRFAAMGA